MKRPSPRTKKRRVFSPYFTVPPLQILLNLDGNSPWGNILEMFEIERSSLIRQNVATKLAHIFAKITNVQMDIGEAFEKKLVEPEELARLYEGLITFFMYEAGSERLILYFPVELIPRIGMAHSNDHLDYTIKIFRKKYLEMWHKLLFHSDTRADFVDGDIPEPELRDGPLPQVTKALHLIPFLRAKELLSLQDVEKLMASHRQFRSEIEAVLAPNLPTTHRQTGSIGITLRMALSALRASRHINHLLDKKLPEARMKWVLQREVEEHIDGAAEEIVRGVTFYHYNVEELYKILEGSHGADIVAICLSALVKIFERTLDSNIDQCESTYQKFEPLLMRRIDGKHSDLILATWSKLGALGLASAWKLEEMAISIPCFHCDCAPSASSRDLVLALATDIHDHEELSKYVLPVILLFGGESKGYARVGSDRDLGVFIKPGVSFAKRARIQELLGHIFTANNVAEKPIEFWLTRTETGLWLKDFEKGDRALGNSLFVNNLFGGFWFGDKKAIEMLYEKLLKQYLYSKKIEICGLPAQEVWLREMESDALQYRLMHKGYHHFYPRRITRGAPEIDSGGAFWDSGFRRVATQIFLKRVYLPQLG